jgi:hypothetical protein
MLCSGPFESDIDATRLTIHSVGDHSFQVGLAQLTTILDDARAASAESGARYDLVFDMTRSAEKKSPDELRSAGEFLAGWIDCLSGRVAVISDDPVLFGMGRVFGSYAESQGLEVCVFRDAASAEAWFASAD